MSFPGPGCVKTGLSRRCSELLSQFAYCQQQVPVRLVSATTKLRWKFYVQVWSLSFHTAWVKNRSLALWRDVRFYPSERTLSVRLGMSEKCQQRTHAPQRLRALPYHPSRTLVQVRPVRVLRPGQA